MLIHLNSSLSSLITFQNYKVPVDSIPANGTNEGIIDITKSGYIAKTANVFAMDNMYYLIPTRCQVEGNKLTVRIKNTHTSSAIETNAHVTVTYIKQ